MGESKHTPCSCWDLKAGRDPFSGDALRHAGTAGYERGSSGGKWHSLGESGCWVGSARAAIKAATGGAE